MWTRPAEHAARGTAASRRRGCSPADAGRSKRCSALLSRAATWVSGGGISRSSRLEGSLGDGGAASPSMHVAQPSTVATAYTSSLANPIDFRRFVHVATANRESANRLSARFRQVRSRSGRVDRVQRCVSRAALRPCEECSFAPGIIVKVEGSAAQNGGRQHARGAPSKFRQFRFRACVALRRSQEMR